MPVGRYRSEIVTGDTPGTATEIARQIGLWKPEDTEKNRITGAAFAELTDEEALDRVMDLKIMSRARPHRQTASGATVAAERCG